jgi:hypothetical protein
MAAMHGKIGVLAAGIAATLSAAALAAAPQVIGIAAAVLNQVRIQPSGAPAHALLLRQRVALGDRIETGQRSQAQLMLLDKSTFTIGANARLTIDRFVYDPKNRSLSATVAKGAFRFMSGRPDRAGDASIGTPVSTIGIRGTIVEGVVGSEAIAIAGHESAINPQVKSDSETASLIVLRGPGVANKAGAMAGSVTVTAGNRTVALDRPMLAAYVPAPGAAPIGPFTISADGLRRLEGLVFESLAEQLRSSTTSGGGFTPVTPYGGSKRTPPWSRQGPGNPWTGPLGPSPGGGPGPGAYAPSGLPSLSSTPVQQPKQIQAPYQQPKQIQSPNKIKNPGQPPNQQKP